MGEEVERRGIHRVEGVGAHGCILDAEEDGACRRRQSGQEGRDLDPALQVEDLAAGEPPRLERDGEREPRLAERARGKGARDHGAIRTAAHPQAHPSARGQGGEEVEEAGEDRGRHPERPGAGRGRRSRGVRRPVGPALQCCRPRCPGSRERRGLKLSPLAPARRQHCLAQPLEPAEGARPAGAQGREGNRLALRRARECLARGPEPCRGEERIGAHPPRVRRQDLNEENGSRGTSLDALLPTVDRGSLAAYAESARGERRSDDRDQGRGYGGGIHHDLARTPGSATAPASSHRAGPVVRPRSRRRRRVSVTRRTAGELLPVLSLATSSLVGRSGSLASQ